MTERRRCARRASLLLWGAVSVGGLILILESQAGAAQLFVEAPESCVDASRLSEEVSDLLGKPLASVPDVDFHLQIAEQPPRRWRLRLEMVAARAVEEGEPDKRGTRELEGRSCTELAEAAAVAISVSVRALAADEARAPAPSSGRPLAADEARAPAPSSGRPLAPRPLPSAALVAPAATGGGEPAGRASPWVPAVALALAGDAGALPGAGLGATFEVSARHRALLFALGATWLGARDATRNDGVSGSFQLTFGSFLACHAPSWGRWTALACGGLEMGRLSGTGRNVARPTPGAVAWEAARAEVGWERALTGSLSLVARLGAVVPRTRPWFVLDQTTPVFRPSAVAARLTLEVEWKL